MVLRVHGWLPQFAVQDNSDVHEHIEYESIALNAFH